MTGDSGFSDLFGNIFGGKYGGVPGAPTVSTPVDRSVRGRMAARRECEKLGHKYRVHGKLHPNKVECGRCEVTWAIGARTEPTT